METIIKNPSWWNRRSVLEKSLLIIVGILILGILAICIALLLVVLLQTTENVCTSPTCVDTASKILKRMNRSVDPCDNFYEFVCGTFAKTAEIPKAKSTITSMTILEDQVKEEMKKVLEEPIHPNETESFVLAKKYYSSCINDTKIELIGLNPVKKILKELGGWPVLEGHNWDSNNFNWRNLTYNLKRRGFANDHIINLYIGTDIKKPTKRVLQLYQANLDLPREFLLVNFTDRSMRAYFDFMIEIAMIFGANKTFAELELLDALMFQRRLAEISIPQQQLRNATAVYNPMFIEELQVRHPSIPWLEFINNMLSPTVQVENEEIVINQVPVYISNLEDLLQTTPNRTIANYLLWQVVKYVANALPKKIQSAQLKFLQTAAGVSELQPRWKKCISSTYSNFDSIIGAMYVRKYIDPSVKTKAGEIFENIRSTFKDNLKQVDWMDDDTRKSALEKLDAMNANIAYPDELLDDEKLDKIFKNVIIKENYFLESMLLVNQWSYNFAYSYLRKPVNKTDWVFHGSSTTIGSYYTFSENSIQLPAGILQGVFFSSERPNYMNYGSIGFTIGHEITHGFDNQGRQYNKDGMIVDWWDPVTEEAFLQKSQCIIDQYSEYTISVSNDDGSYDVININGKLTEGENIADNGGIKQAYKAYKKWIEKNDNKQEPKLPGLPYSPLQMFWISMGHTWCSRSRPNHEKLLILVDPHAPASYRVIGSITNQPEFSKDFNCPAESRMNSEHKCHVW